MTSLGEAIRTFRGDGGSRDEFFAGVDRRTGGRTVSCIRLLEILDEERAASRCRPIFMRQCAGASNRGLMRPEPIPIGAADSDGAPMETFAGLRATSRRVERRYRHSGDPGHGRPRQQVKGVGDTLNGRFVLEECIGFGGMGTVYKALDLRKLEASDRKPYIAIKVLNVQFRGHPKSLIALQREARKAQALAHPNIVTVYDFDRDGPIVYLTMEYLSGKPLSQMLRTPGFKGMPCADGVAIVQRHGERAGLCA